MQTGSDSVSARTISRKVGRTRSNESGKLMPSRRGHDSQVAECGSHSAGMRYPSSRGIVLSLGEDMAANVRQSASSVQRHFENGEPFTHEFAVLPPAHSACADLVVLSL